MSFGRKPLPPRRDRSAEFASFTPAPAVARMATREDLSGAPLALVVRQQRLQKIPQRKQQAIRDSARGEDCTVLIPGCPGDPAMTIWSHAPLKAAGKGMQLKAIDLCGAFACTYCDAVVDGQRPPPPGFTRAEALMAWFYGHMKSLVRLHQKGLV